MASEGNTSWRSAAGASAKPSASGPAWRAAPPKRSWMKRLRSGRAGIGWVAFLLATAGLIWVATWVRPPRPGQLLLLTADYDDNLTFPTNVTGRNFLTGLSQLSPGPVSKKKTGFLIQFDPKNQRDLRTEAAWDLGLDKLKKQVLVFAIAAHGGVDDKGPYLLASNADLRDDPFHRIRMEKVLDRLGQMPGTLPKMLILDPTQVASHWPLGMLHNDFSRSLAELDDKILAVPNLVVLCSTGPDQISHTSQEWRTSIFGHFLKEALRGGADIDGDRRIDAHELHQYLVLNVDRWAKINRLAAQTPMLLPRGDEGIRRAQNLLLALAERNFVPAEPESTPVFAMPDSLEKNWQRWKTLSDLTPHPATLTPYQWQQFQASILRAEQLYRLGDEAGAKKLESRLNDLEGVIRKAPNLPVRSLGNSLALPLWAGDPEPSLDPETEKRFKAFWDAKTSDDAKKMWLEWQKAAKEDKTFVMPSRRLFQTLLVERAAQDPVQSLEPAAERLRIVRDLEAAPPAEAHFAVMMNRDLPKNPPSQEYPDALPMALKLRSFGERVAVSYEPGLFPYGEQIYPWIEARLLGADLQRQLGQDLLLSGSAKDWAKAQKHLMLAGSDYEAIQKDATMLRAAYMARDRAQAQLPFLTHWAANPNVDPTFDASLRQLWPQINDLIAQLENPNPASISQPNFAELTIKVSQGLADLDRRFDDYLQSLRTARTISFEESRKVWLDTEWALQVPQRDVKRRMELIERQHRLSRRILVEGQTRPLTTLPRSSGELARLRTQREGWLVLSSLGKANFDQVTALKSENYDQIRHRLEIFGVEEKWWLSIREAGYQIGLREQRLATDTRKLATLDSKATLPTQRAALRQADALTRRMEANIPWPNKTPDAAMLFRRQQLFDFFVGQAKRTQQDHWFDDSPTAEPYYRTAARSFLGDARSLMAGHLSQGAKEELASLEQSLRLPGELQLVDTTGRPVDAAGKLIPGGNLSTVITSEQALAREYRLMPFDAKDHLPTGYPMVWVETYRGLKPSQPLERQRQAISITPQSQQLDKAEPILTRFISPPVLAVEDKSPDQTLIERTSLTLKGLYRGQPITRETRLELHPVAETVVRELPLPERASVAVRTKKEILTKSGGSLGGVAFVIDCSGSMRQRDNAPPEESRYHQAMTAFRQVLQKVPKDAVVSVWIFGEAMGGDKTVSQAEQTIRQALPPTVWNPDDPNQLNLALGTLSYPGAVEPWNESPLVRTLLSAKQDLKGVKGFKTILAITDGGDNRFEKDPALKEKYGSISGFLRTEFQDSGILLNLVGFPPADKNEEASRVEFKTIEKFQPAGKIYTVSDGPKLAETMESVLRQRLNYWIDRQGQNVLVDDVPETGLDVSPAGSNYRWVGGGLKPGGHKVRVDVAGRVEKNVLLNRGDLLLLDLVDTPKGLDFERFLFSEEFPWKRSLPNQRNDWRLTVMQNQLLSKSTIQMLLTLEKTVDRRESILEQIKPREIWIEVTSPKNSDSAAATRWSYLPRYPAPAWSVDISAWPMQPGTTNPARPHVAVWWNPDEEARSNAELELKPLLGARDRPIVVQNEENVVLESLTVEPHRVETAPGVFAVRQCLVVRLRHSKDRPILARLQGIAPAGGEQRLYGAAGKTTNLFWWEPDRDITKNPAELANLRLRLISVQAFKDEAKQRGFSAEIPDLDPPEPTDYRPRAPLELK